MTSLIRVRDLTRDYAVTRRREGVWGGFVDLVRPRRDTLRAVNRVSFDIEPGEMVGYIGANGAGKSTTIKMLTGILTPTSGEVSVGGLVPHRDRLHYTRHIGAVFGQRTQLWWDLAVVESFRLLKKIYEVPDADYEQVLRAIRTRDQRDSTRAVAPLIKPKGAVVIDTTDMNIEEVTAELLRRVKSAR